MWFGCERCISIEVNQRLILAKMDQLWISFGSLVGIIAFIRTILPPEFRGIFRRLSYFLFDYLSRFSYFEVHETSGTFDFNELYEFIQLYLSSSTSTSAQRATVALPKNSQSLTFNLTGGGKVKDKFNGAELWWKHHSEMPQDDSNNFFGSRRPNQRRYYVLQISKKDRQRTLDDYFKHIIVEGKRLKFSSRQKKLYTNVSGSRPWESVPFKHPSTFKSLALDPARKEEIINDLEAFKKGEDFYRGVGRAWKRGYLLYGPPGTGKSSMIAAIANFMDYDVYDLELTEVKSNAHLRKLLIHTSNKSVIVIEDIDCSVNLSDRAKESKKKRRLESQMPDDHKNMEEEEGSRFTLSGLLNFTDGLWSCCGSERIIVFTTNHIEKLDGALLRSGRMDKHIHMSYCTFPAFKILATNYLNVSEHELFSEIEESLDEAMITPADISEIMTHKRDYVSGDPSEALEGVIEALKAAKDKLKVEEKREVSGGEIQQTSTDAAKVELEETASARIATA